MDKIDEGFDLESKEYKGDYRCTTCGKTALHKRIYDGNHKIKADVVTHVDKHQEVWRMDEDQDVVERVLAKVMPDDIDTEAKIHQMLDDE